uniref:Eukaryotic translation initiation factor 4C n=1 Tax=Rhabditophanes sp. KR3021 TaxID=114890 RepID=A0AC35TQY5_9BILA
MPKNKGKGGKNRRRGKNESDFMKRELIKKDSDDQEYAQVLKMLGNGRLIAFCFDGKERLCHIRGKMRKKVWINTGDIILIGLRDYQDAKADVILKYTPDEARILKSEGHLPESAKLNEAGDEIEENDVDFVDLGGNEEITKDTSDDNISDSDSSDEDEEESDEEEGKKGSSDESSEDGSSSEGDSSDLDEEELARGRGGHSKPGARDRYGKANKGKRNK